MEEGSREGRETAGSACKRTCKALTSPDRTRVKIEGAAGFWADEVTLGVLAMAGSRECRKRNGESSEKKSQNEGGVVAQEDKDDLDLLLLPEQLSSWGDLTWRGHYGVQPGMGGPKKWRRS